MPPASGASSLLDGGVYYSELAIGPLLRQGTACNAEDKTICTTLFFCPAFAFFSVCYVTNLSIAWSRYTGILFFHLLLIHNGPVYVESGHLVGASVTLCCLVRCTFYRGSPPESRSSMEKDGTL